MSNCSWFRKKFHNFNCQNTSRLGNFDLTLKLFFQNGILQHAMKWYIKEGGYCRTRFSVLSQYNIIGLTRRAFIDPYYCVLCVVN